MTPAKPLTLKEKLARVVLHELSVEDCHGKATAWVVRYRYAEIHGGTWKEPKVSVDWYTDREGAERRVAHLHRGVRATHRRESRKARKPVGSA